MSKHTPGPWKITENNGAHVFVRSEDTGDNQMCAKVWLNGNDFSDANARLIAAAPEMLELLKSVQANRKLLNDEHFSGVSEKLFALIASTIAKAEGRE